MSQETQEVDGHVIASNPLGEAYVVPLQATLHQISEELGAKELLLPNPRVLMANLVVHYYKAGDIDLIVRTAILLDGWRFPRLRRVGT